MSLFLRKECHPGAQPTRDYLMWVFHRDSKRLFMAALDGIYNMATVAFTARQQLSGIHCIVKVVPKGTFFVISRCDRKNEWQCVGELGPPIDLL